MIGVFTGVGVIATIVGVGYLCARLGVLGPSAVEALVRTSYFIATPALSFLIIARSDWRLTLQAPTIVAVASAIVAALVAVALVLVFARRSAAATTITAASAIFVNSNNMGLPVATFVVGDPAAVATVLLLQPLVVSPVIITLLELFTRGRPSLLTAVLGPVRNPILIGAALGLLVSVTEFELPAGVLAPIDIVAGASIPIMLIAFGVSLHNQLPLAAGTDRRSVVIAVLVKCLVMPLAAWIVAGPLLGLEPEVVFAAVIVAALPTGQLMYAYAVRFGAVASVARDTVAVSSVLCIPVIVIASLLLGHVS